MLTDFLDNQRNTVRGLYNVDFALRKALRAFGAWSSSIKSHTSLAVKDFDHPFMITGSTQLNVARESKLAVCS